MKTLAALIEADNRESLLDLRKFYIDGKWTSPVERNDFLIINPATEEAIATISLGGQADVDKAAAAANQAFPSYSETSVAERKILLQRVIDAYRARTNEMEETISAEMGAPISLSRNAQVPSGLLQFSTTLKLMEKFDFEALQGTTLMRKEPIGVCGLITPWNWPLNQ